ncbi:MAG: dTDP-4-dehydrorhamnose 3,5-epimerase, partial [Pedobacter sp.]
FYKCDNFYQKDAEVGIMYNDQELNIDWLIPAGKEAVSDKDLILQNFSSLK